MAAAMQGSLPLLGNREPFEERGKGKGEKGKGKRDR
jgi:hypothetical protein